VTTPRAISLLAALLAVSWSLNACARDPDPALSQWKAGTNYQLLASPQPTNVAAGRVEVAEVFWYGCGHCYALDPSLETWKAAKAAYIDFVRVPVIWGQAHRQHAKLYYTLQALHRPDLHTQVFDAIHQHGTPLSSRDDLEARAQQLAFLESKGVTAKEFNAAYDSMTVAINMQRAEQLTTNYAIANVPTLIVSGKYSTSVGEAGGTEQLLTLINDLAASEKNR
jgi:protein dithiol oxidoreductase (disulfide-forming)